MGSPNKSNELPKNEDKPKFFDYKGRVLRKLEKQTKEYKESSSSWIFMNRMGGMVLDLLGWVLLIVALYFYIKSGRGLTTEITCNKITPDFCNSCFVYGKNLVTGAMQNLNNVSLGINESIDGLRNMRVLP